MSYILDALKKSEKERKRGKVPNLSNSPEPPAEKHKKSSLWPYITVIVLVLNAGLIYWWFAPEKSEKTVTETKQHLQGKIPDVYEDTEMSHAQKTQDKAVIISENAMNLSETGDAARSASTARKEKIRQQTEKEHSSLTKATVPTDDAIDQQETFVPPLPVQGDDRKNIPDQPKTAGMGQLRTETNGAEQTVPQHVSEPTPVQGRVYALSELPMSLQQELPSFNITMSLYSDDPATRVAKINGQTLKEGQFLSDGLKLEEIKPDGVILNYRDYRFRVILK